MPRRFVIVVMGVVALAGCRPSHPEASPLPAGTFKSIGIEFPQPYLGFATVPGWTFMMPASVGTTLAHMDSVLAGRHLQRNGDFPGGLVVSSGDLAECADDFAVVVCRLAYVIFYRPAGSQTEVSVGALEVRTGATAERGTSMPTTSETTIRDNGAVGRLVKPMGRNWPAVQKLATAIFNELPAQ